MLCLVSAGCAITSTPPTQARPAVGTTIVVNMPTVVVLPAPFGPRSPKISPRFNDRLRLSTAFRPPGYTFVRPSVCTTVSASAGGPTVGSVDMGSRAPDHGGVRVPMVADSVQRPFEDFDLVVAQQGAELGVDAHRDLAQLGVAPVPRA